MDQLSKSRVLPYVPVILVALTLLYMVVEVRVIGDYGVETDFYGTFAPRAERIIQGEFQPRDYGVVGPLFELLLAMGIGLGIPAFLFGKLVSVFCAVGTMLIWMRLGERMVGPRGAWVVPWMFLLAPAFFEHGYLASSDMLFLFLSSATILCIVKAETRKDLMIAVVLGILSFLVRYVAVVLPIFAVVWFFRGERWLRKTAIYVAGFSAVLASLYGVSALFGDPPRPDFLFNVDFELRDEDWDSYHRTADERGSAIDAVTRHGTRLISNSLANIPGHLRTEARDAAGWVLVALALVGIFLRIQGRKTFKEPGSLRILALWLLQFAPILLIQSSPRYSLPQIPIYAVAAAWAVAGIGSWKPGKRVMPAFLGAIVLAGLVFNVRHVVAYQERRPTAVAAIATSARGAVPLGSRIMARKPHLSYLLGGEWIQFPDSETLEELREEMRARGVHYVLYDGNTYTLRPRFRFLNFAPYRPPGWEVVTDLLLAGVLYRIHPEFYTTPIPADDMDLRHLQNNMLSTTEPVPAARVLARFLAETGRCQAALQEYDRLSKFVELTPEELKLVESCRGRR